MTREEADVLGKRIINTFRLTPALPEWIDVLEAREQVRAMRAFKRCRERVDGALSIKRFVDEYDACAPKRHVPTGCQRCGDSGWVNVAGGDPRRHGPGCPRDDRCHCHAVEPCPCRVSGLPYREWDDTEPAVPTVSATPQQRVF